MHTSLHVSIGSAKKQKNLCVFHLDMFCSQSTYLLMLTVRLRLQFSSVTLWASAWRVLLHCTSSPLFILLAFALERISLFIFSVPIIQTLLNWHYLTKKSGPYKRDLTVLYYLFYDFACFCEGSFCTFSSESRWLVRSVVIGSAAFEEWYKLKSS